LKEETTTKETVYSSMALRRTVQQQSAVLIGAGVAGAAIAGKLLLNVCFVVVS